MIETIFTYKNLYRAYLECRERKRKTINALKFEYELENNLYKLLNELKSRSYKPGRSTCFVVTKPTVREIFAADFRDRVVHHLFVNELMETAEKRFCFDSYACRMGKGTHKAVRRIRQFIPKVTENYKKEAYFLQLDIKSFFMSIDQKILFGIIEKYIERAEKASPHACHPHKTTSDVVKTGNVEIMGLDSRLRGNDNEDGLNNNGEGGNDPNTLHSSLKLRTIKKLRWASEGGEGNEGGRNDKGGWKDEMLWLAKVIVFNKTTENYAVKGKKELFELLPKGKSLFEAEEFKGLPIGNLTSQFFANLYLNEVDQFIKRELNCKFYVRYVDDFVILENDIKVLTEIAPKIDAFLNNNLGLALSHKKTKLKNVKEGIDFLGYLIKPEYMLVRRKVVERFWEKLWGVEMNSPLNIGKTIVEESSVVREKKMKAIAASYFGHFKHANAYFLKKNLKTELTG